MRLSAPFRDCWTGAHHVPRPWVRVGPRTPALQHSLADGPRLRRNVPDSMAGPRLPGRGPGRPGTCGRRVPATPRLSGVRGAPSPARASPGRILSLLPGIAGVGPASPRPPAPHTAPVLALTGLGCCPASAFPGGPWRFRTRESGRGVSQHRPENGRRRLGSAGPARPRRRVGDATRQGRGLLGLSRGPDSGAPTSVPRTRPREDRGRAGTWGGGEGGTHTSAPQNPKPNLGTTGRGGGAHDGPRCHQGGCGLSLSPLGRSQNPPQGQPLRGLRPQNLVRTRTRPGFADGSPGSASRSQTASNPCPFKSGRFQSKSTAVFI